MEYIHALCRYVLFLVTDPKGNQYSDLHPYRLVLPGVDLHKDGIIVCTMPLYIVCT